MASTVRSARDDPAITTWSAFLRAHAAIVGALEREVEPETGLPLAWYDVLLELNAADRGGLRMGELGERAVLSRTRVSRIVDELVAVGYACRTPNPQDRRSSHAEITAEGRKALRKAAPRYFDAVRRNFSQQLSAGQLTTIRAAMEGLIAHHAPPP
ncbi:MAG: MarR family winged helix-turn-helix transcriptional regulator [Actinomycetota bacterium]|nr:MarR family winged helix-turn-helix transcriptional regulator [Actinomycetota bacterium]